MKKLLLILALTIQGVVFAQETKTQLETRFNVIKNELVAGANTKTRIANAYQELSDGTIGVYPVNATGTNAYSGTLLGLDAYSGRIVFVTFANNNTGAVTINLTSIGADDVQKEQGGNWVNLEADDIIAGKLYRLYHDGTRFQIDLGGAGLIDGDYGDVTVSSSGTTITIDNGSVTGSKITSSVALGGNPTTTTQSANTNNTTIATTAYVDAKIVDAITDGATTTGPSRNAVYDALQELELALEAVQGSLGINVEELGVASDGETIVTDTLQSIINTYVGQKIIIGTDKSKIFLIDEVLHIPANSDIHYDGQIKLDSGHTRPLLADVLDGATYALVDNATDHFKENQRIVISDDDQPVAGGGAWKTRKKGNTNVITSISGDTLFFLHTFSGIDNGGFTVAANAKIGQANSILSLEGDNITITGNGVLDGNLPEQYNIVGSTYNDIVEDLQASCGITMNDVSNINIVGNMTIRRMTLHGIATSHLLGQKTELLTINGVTIDSCMDKSIAGLDIHKGRISNGRNINGIDEGDVIFYNGNHDVVLNNWTSYGNRRYGIAATGQNNSQLQVSNCFSITSKNKPTTYNFYFQNQLNGTEITNISASSENMDATWTRSTTTVTVTTPVEHNLTNGQTIFITVKSVATAFDVGAHTITTTGSTTFTFTCTNTGFSSGTLSYVGMATDGAIVFNSTIDADLKNANIYNHPLASVGVAMNAGTVYSDTALNNRIDGLVIKNSNLVSARALSFLDTKGAIIKNVTVDSVFRVFADGATNEEIIIDGGDFKNFTSLFETDNSHIKFTGKINGITVNNTSQATVENGYTQVVVNHGMDITPRVEDIHLEPVVLGNVQTWLKGNVTSKSFTIYVDQDPGATGAIFKWYIEDFIGTKSSEPDYTDSYVSDYSSGVDGITSTRVTSSGNNDGISDGTHSFDNVLKVFCDGSTNTHEISKAIANVGTLNRITLKYYIPPAQTHVDGFRIYANTFTTTVIDVNQLVVGEWREVTSGTFTAASTTINIRAMDGFATSFTGANSSSDDIIYFKDIRVEYVSGTKTESNGVTLPPTFASASSGTVTNVATGNGLTGGPITTTGTISGVDAEADGATKGVAAYTAADFNTSSGVVSTDYTNGQAASGSTKGFLTSTDWTTFNNKQSTGLSWLLASGGTLTGNNSISGAFNVDFSASRLQFTQGVLTSSWSPVLKTIAGAHTSMTAATEFISQDFTGATQQWLAGTVATQRFNYFRGYTIAGASASNTVTNAYTVYIEPSIQGTNAIISNNFALGISGSLATPLRNLISNTNAGASATSTIQFVNDGSRGGLLVQNSGANSGLGGASSFNITTSDNTVPLTLGTNSTTRFNIGATGLLTYSNSPTFTSTWVTYTQTAATSGTVAGMLWTGGAHTGLTASTESSDINYNLARTVQFSTGALTTQRAFKIQAPTYGFVGSSTLTDAYTFHVSGAPVAGTNATITRSWAAGFGGNVFIGTGTPTTGSVLLDLNSTTMAPVLPRMTKTQRDAIATPVAGMAIYQTDNTPGLRVYNGTNWMRFTETAD